MSPDAAVETYLPEGIAGYRFVAEKKYKVDNRYKGGTEIALNRFFTTVQTSPGKISDIWVHKSFSDLCAAHAYRKDF